MGQIHELLTAAEELLGEADDQSDHLSAVTVTTVGGLRITVEIPAIRPRLPEASTRPRSPPPPVASPPPPPQTGVAHSDDFRSFRVGEVVYSLGPDQAKVVEILFRAWLRGSPDTSGDFLLNEIEREGVTLRHVFRGSKAWKTLVTPGGTRGSYRLDIPRECHVEASQEARTE